MQQAGVGVKEQLAHLNPHILSVINDSRLNQKSLDTLNLALELIGSYTKEEREPLVDLLSSPKQKVSDYQSSIIMDDTQEKLLPQGMMNYKVVEMMLVRYRDDFQYLLSNIYNDIKRLCVSEDNNGLNILLIENIWMSDLLSYSDGELGVLAAKNGYEKILAVLYSKSPEMKNYSQKFLNVAVESNQLPCVQYLLEQGADPLPLLGTENYYKNEQIVDLFTEYLISQGNTLNSNFYKGMYLYKSNKYDKAINSLQEVVALNSDSDFTILSFYYLGLCCQYSKEYDDAKLYFNKVIGCETTYSDQIKIKSDAQEHIKVISSLKEATEKFGEHQHKIQVMLQHIDHNEILKKILYSEFEPKVSNFMTKILEQNSVDITKSFKELQQLLAETKYIKIIKEVPEKILLALEFEDVQQIRDQFTTEFIEQDQRYYHTYTEALSIISDTSKLIGEVSNGMIIED